MQTPILTFLSALQTENEKLKKEKYDLNIQLVSKSDEVIKMDQKLKKFKPNPF